MKSMLPRIYPITDVRLSGLTHAEQVRRLAEGGARMVQLREKKASPREFYEAAVEAVRVARTLDVKIIINDRIDIALAVGADGVHLGQDDLPVEEARRLIGPDKIIGFSTHNLKQALGADLLAADYIAIGPVFGTSTKENPDPATGLEMVREVKRQIAKPLVAIGGITLERARSVFDAGADSLAVISDLYSTEDIAARMRSLLES
jgi:thiamine-phosphate pyrophosphorylase